MAGPTEITTRQLARLIGVPDAPRVIDVRIEEDFALDPRLIPGARRWPAQDAAALADRLRGRRVVVVCQKGRKLSQGAAALLRAEGIAAETLEGGMIRWAEEGLPAAPAAAIPGPLWVTRHRPKIDRIACPWLIRRFVDPDARFLFVAPGEVRAVAERFDATPFDVEGADWSNRGERCTFDVMLERFGLETEPLLRVAAIVRGADTARPELAPEAAGLLALSLGLSRMHRDDLEQVDAGMILYDALYRWARDAADETHDWPGAGA